MLYRLWIPTLCAISMGLLLGSGTAAAEEKSFPGIENLMTWQEFNDAGLDKLTPKEREVLNQWLIRYTVEDSQVLLNTSEDVKKASDELEIISVILPPFKGWSGDTIFRLENGQVWQQRSGGNYPYRGSNPQVRISKNFMGFYRMELVENGNTVQIKRLK